MFLAIFFLQCGADDCKCGDACTECRASAEVQVDSALVASIVDRATGTWTGDYPAENEFAAFHFSLTIVPRDGADPHGFEPYSDDVSCELDASACQHTAVPVTAISEGFPFPFEVAEVVAGTTLSPVDAEKLQAADAAGLREAPILWSLPQDGGKYSLQLAFDPDGAAWINVWSAEAETTGAQRVYHRFARSERAPGGR